MDAVRLGKNVERERLVRKLTQAQLGEACNIAQGNISKYESGKTLPDLESLLRICAFFEVTLDTLVFGTAAAPQPHDAEVPPSAQARGLESRLEHVRKELQRLAVLATRIAASAATAAEEVPEAPAKSRPARGSSAGRAVARRAPSR